MYFHPRTNGKEKPAEPPSDRPTASAEDWLGRNRTEKRQLWERLSPRHRKTLRLLAEVLAAHQNHAKLEETTRGKIAQLVSDVERLAARAVTILAEVARRTRPRA